MLPGKGKLGLLPIDSAESAVSQGSRRSIGLSFPTECGQPPHWPTVSGDKRQSSALFTLAWSLVLDRTAFRHSWKTPMSISYFIVASFP